MKARALCRLFSNSAQKAKENSLPKTQAPSETWRVDRIDTNGVTYRMFGGLTKKKAEKIAQEYEDKGHHQGYWATKENPK